jgi:hypothetical protein
MIDLKRFHLLPTLMLLHSMSACAAIIPTAEFTGYGDANPERDIEIAERFEANETPIAESAKIRVLIDTIPEGLVFDDGQLSVTEGYAHEIRGKFSLRNSGLLGFYFFAWFFPYEDDWRKGLCYWQVPLEWVTLGLWSVVPTSYPCHPDRRLEKKAWVSYARALALEADADGVIMSYIFSDRKNAHGASGFLIVLDPRMKAGSLKTKPLHMSLDGR